MIRITTVLLACLALLGGRPHLGDAQSLTCNWTDPNPDEDGTTIERGTAATGPFTVVGSVGPNVVTFPDGAGLLYDTAYYYRVRAFNAAGVSGYSNIACSCTAPSGPVPVAAYSFSENTGTTTADATGNAHTGTLTNGPTWTASGKYGSAIVFDGVNDFVTVPSATGIGFGATGTIEAWVKIAVTSHWHGVVAKGATTADSAQNYNIEISDTNKVACVIGNGATSNLVVGTTSITIGTFTHVACSWDGALLKVYVGGVLDASTAETITPATNTAALTIGQSGGSSGDKFQGTIDSVKLYNVTRSQAEIQADMLVP